MQLSVKGRRRDVGNALRSHVPETLDITAARYFGNPIEASVVFSREAHLYRADVSVHVGRNILLQSEAEAEDAHVAFDVAADGYKRRLKDHHKDNGAVSRAATTARAHVFEGARGGEAEDDKPAQPVVAAEMTMPTDTMSVSEAVMRLDLGDLTALMFRNGGHGRPDMTHRRPDGNIGWIDPRQSPGTGA